MSRLKVGLQMYTLRDELAKDFLGTLRQAAKLGYEGVEFAGYGGLTAPELRAELDALGIVSLGSHISLARMLEAADEEIEYNLTLGSKYIIVPWLPEERYKDEEAVRQTAKDLEAIGKKVTERGLTFCYHNHSFEFEKQIGGQTMFDFIFGSASADVLQVELDACWAFNAGFAPVEVINQYSGRLPLVHFKDLQRGGEKPLTVELGKGEVDLIGIAKAAKEAGTEWLIVEQDFCQNPPLESVANSIEWMRQQGLR
jgi:sugar phosphate isomerase/epimerase